MDSYRIYRKANDLIKQCGTRDPQKIASELGIWVYDVNDFHDLLGMYTFRWNCPLPAKIDRKKVKKTE